MKARPALVALMRSSEEWRGFFKRCTETSPLLLRSQAWQWRDELHARGQDVDPGDVEDALCDLAGELLPDSPGATWDEEHAAKLAADALSWLAEWFPECSGALALNGPTEAADAAATAGEHARYREALRSLCWAGRDEALRIRRSAA
jgi:hypothetical protein